MLTKIQRVTDDLNRRIIAISDIHGNYHYLRGLLKKVEYSDQDMLVFVGDLIEKGPQSLKTVQYILELRRNSKYVYAVMGNVEYARLSAFFDDSEEGNREFLNGLRYAKEVWKAGLFLDMLEEMGIEWTELSITDIADVKKQMKERYGEELFFLWNLPTILAVGNYIFVHAGIPTDHLEELEHTEAFPYLKTDAFLKQNVRFDACVVVGHWPVALYNDTTDQMNPILNEEKHIAAIDGGCALKIGEQLNALLIPNPYADMKELTCKAYDDFPKIIARYSQQPRKRTVGIRYFDDKVSVVEEAGDMVILRHVSTGTVFQAPKSYLYEREDGIHCNDYHDGLLAVDEGDELSVIEETSIGAIVKKNGEIGWYLNGGIPLTFEKSRLNL